jgi:hypothetical protein
MLKRSYSEDTFDLEELDQHGGIEHDGSLLREQFPPLLLVNYVKDKSLGLDAAFQPDQSVKHVPFIEELLAAATGKDKDGNDLITTKDLSRILGKRRAVARAVNKGFSDSFFHRIFGSTKYVIAPSLFEHTFERSVSAATLVTVFGGRVEDLRSFLLHEQIPESWESRIRQPHGLTMMTFNKTILRVEFGVCEQEWTEAAREAVEPRTPSA